MQASDISHAATPCVPRTLQGWGDPCTPRCQAEPPRGACAARSCSPVPSQPGPSLSRHLRAMFAETMSVVLQPSTGGCVPPPRHDNSERKRERESPEPPGRRNGLCDMEEAVAAGSNSVPLVSSVWGS